MDALCKRTLYLLGLIAVMITTVNGQVAAVGPLPECGGKLTGLSGYMVSPTMPDRNFYYPNQKCKWEIPLKLGYRITVEINHFELEEANFIGKCFDYVSFNFVRKCGILPQGESFGPYTNGLGVEFFSSPSVVKAGFNISFTQEKIPICVPPCANGGSCIKDGLCQCVGGFAGFRCRYATVAQSNVITDGAVGNVKARETCTVYGQKNVRTFDGKMFNIPTNCEYALMEFGDAKVFVAMKDPQDRGLTATKKITVSRGVQSVIIQPDATGKFHARDSKGRLLKVPNFFGPFELMEPYQKVRVKDEDFIVDVDIDGSNVYICALASLEKGAIRGLCGNYNGNITDDMMSASGNMARDDEMLALAWNQDKSCVASTTSIALQDKSVASDICNQLRAPSFSACLSALPVENYYTACMNDMRLCGYKSRADCNCPSITQYARDCAKARITPELTWRQGLCEKQCPGNQVFSECAPYCAKTCQSLGTVAKCRNDCVDGCTCPGNSYWDGSTCVAKEDCPCHVGEVKYAKNQKFEEKCRKCECINGTLQCTPKPCDGTAVVFGNPYFHTFDGLWYTFDGVCSYTLLRGPAPEYVRMIISTKKCGTESASTCIDNIIISSEVSPTVKLITKGSVIVDDQTADLPYVKKDKLDIYTLTSSYIIVHLLTVNIRVKWNAEGTAVIYVPYSYQGKLGGLLGNFNGKTNDEFLSPNGIVENTPILFAQSWEARTQCTHPKIENQGSCKLLDEDRKLCHQGIYNDAAFQNCIAVSSDEEPLKGMCQDMACTSLGAEKKKQICQTLSVFALLCAFKGHVANWRNSTYCNITCTNGKVYEPWGSSCGRTCRGLTSNETCTDITPKAEGCVCPEGKYENKDGICVDQTNCDCYYNGAWIKNGGFFVYDQRDCDCVRGRVTCTSEKNIKCGTELQYKDCTKQSVGADCQPTCGDKNPVCAGTCVSGCGCPEGQYMHNGKCFYEKDCPCTYEGKDYSHNERVIDNCDQCTCNHGKWVCVKTNMCTGFCSLTSGSYYKTFDDSRFHSRGTCKYILMTDKCPGSPDGRNYFEISAQSHPCKDTGYKMCNLTIHARFGNDAFVLARGHDIVEEFSGVHSRYFYHILTRKLNIGFYQVIEADFNSYYIQLRYDMKTSLTIEVSKNISIHSARTGRQLCGLCGNMDGSSSNDFKTKYGLGDPMTFINEWRMEDCAELPREEISSCLGKSVQEDNAKRQCRIINGALFSACHNKIDPKPFYDTCIEETCNCETGGQCECYCSAVSAYAEACGRRGAKVNWRLVTGCPVECQEFTSPDTDLCDIKYNPCQPCVKTCCSKCARGCFEGCFPSCKKGLVFNPTNQTCIPEEQCICPKAPTYIVPTRPTTTATSTASTLTELFTSASTTTEESTATAKTAPSRYACPYYCKTNVGKTKEVGESWFEGCLNLTCVVDETGCTNITKEERKCKGPPVCKEYETQVFVKTDECDCDHFKCECDKCTHGENTYNLTEKWKEGDCVTMVCDKTSCPNAREESDRRNFCSQTADTISCRKYYKQVPDNSDPCCPKNKCVCDNSSCPEAPSCISGTQVDSDRSNDCCTVLKCQPSCVYNGKQYKNGTSVSQSQCYDEYCRCDDEKCSVNKENEVTCTGINSKKCINDDTSHFGSFSTQGGCCTENKCNCECRVYGDPHYHTFDGTRYTFPGVCPYTLVKYKDSDDLHIIGDNEACDQKPGSCLKRVIIHWKTIKIILSADGTIDIDGESISAKSLPKRITRDVRLSRTRCGEIILRIRPIAMTLRFQITNGIGNLNMKVPMSKLYNNTVGLCGTCSNDRNDDFETSHGNHTNNTEEFGTSWQYNKTKDKVCLPCRDSTDIECLTCEEIKKTKVESAWPERCNRCPDSDPCSQLRHEMFNNSCTIKPERFEKSCYSDENMARQCSVCNASSFVQYAKNCGRCVKWRTAFNCTPVCPQGQVFKDCVSECDLDRTCQNMNAPGVCDSQDTSGCGCPAGMVFLDTTREKCVEEKCCNCPDPQCKAYEVAVPVPNQDPNDCCAKKVCQCKETANNITCTAPKEPTSTDKDTPGCNQTVCVCPAKPECPLITKNCNSPGCTPSEEIGECGCTAKIECKCNSAACPPLRECGKCQRRNVSYADDDTSQPCGGNCCPIVNCLPVECPENLPQSKNYTECPFLKDEPSTFESSDTDKCCPKSYEPACIKEKCDVLKIAKNCPLGYTLQAQKVSAASDPDVSKYSSCPSVDQCCQYKECVCTSCVDGLEKLLPGQERFENDGCKRISCKVEERNQDGCYNITVQTPTCPKRPTCKCYQQLRETSPPRGATNMDEWLSLCCPKYACEDLPCLPGYSSGPDACTYPAKRNVDYLTIDGCLYPQCSTASCECDLCLDSENKTHSIGDLLPGSDKCTNHTCIKDDLSECPKFKTSRVECDQLTCNSDYEVLNSESNPSKCCPQQKCICKPEKMLQEVCKDYKNDTSTCSDPQNMLLQKTGKNYGHECCPEKQCTCKPESQLNCTTKSCDENYDLVKKSNASETKCCAEYECICDCEKKSCQYKSWVASSVSDGCQCTCVCDSSRCDSRKPTCLEGEHVVIARYIDDGCCPVYECKCNTSACDPVPSANCNQYQIEYPWKKSKDDCCPTKNKCKCNPNADELRRICNETSGASPHNCSKGWEPYVANVMASQDDTMCCDTQCRCVSCQTTNGTVVEVGTYWEETKNCKVLTNICSDKLLTNGCHKITTTERDVSCEYKSLGDYEEKHCKANTYAVQVSPQVGCCPSYKCVECTTNEWVCTSYAERRRPNATNPRCPGDCICDHPLMEEQDNWCLNEAKCGEFETAQRLQPEESGITHPDKCCPAYKCVCAKCPSSVVTEESLNPRPEYCEVAGVRSSDIDKKCCKNYEIQCNKRCSCRDIDLNCTSQENACLQSTTSTNMCKCPTQANCVCHKDLCPSVTCKECEVLITENADPDSSIPCNGNCCPKQKCVKKPCLKITDPLIPPECTFLKKVDKFGSDMCCPVSKDIKCKDDKSICPYNTEITCSPGLELETVHANDSENSLVQAVKHCPMVDMCCPHQVCVCKSCKYEGGRLKLGDPPAFSSDGCTEYTCTRRQATLDGCYKVTVKTPECNPPPPLECYQTSTEIPANPITSNESDWKIRCCPNHRVENKPCGEDYEAGPTFCAFPGRLEVSYKTIDGCKYEHCPIRKCICDKCFDANNNTYSIGSTHSTPDGCDSFNCLASTGDEQACPVLEKKARNCPTLSCNAKYETLKEDVVEGACCPNHTCICKPEEMLKTTCNEWLEDASNCSDPLNMMVQLTGTFREHKCCPEKECICKPKEIRTCSKPSCSPNQKLVETVPASGKNCCAEYECQCDCESVTCPYPSQVVKNTPGSCDCKCVCDPSRCKNETKTCAPGEQLTQSGTTEDGCCPAYKCVCDESSCPTPPSANCNKFQIEYPWKDTVGACCPKENRCKCNPVAEELKRLCNESRHAIPNDCKEGYEKYVSSVMTENSDGVCCDMQCRCVSCEMENGTIAKVGDKWTETKGCKIIKKYCSNKQLPNTCYKIESEENPVPCTYSTPESYAADNCEPFTYAVDNSTEGACCPSYNCVPCSTNSWTCDSPHEERQPDSSNSRCPGNCTCVSPMTEDNNKACLDVAKCGPYEKAAQLGEGEQGVKHPDHCCPNYKCVCDTCPSGTVTQDQLAPNPGLCEVVSVRESDANRTCCKNYEITCNEPCSCQEGVLNCNSTTGCIQKPGVANKCGCSKTATCECNKESCPQMSCGKCEDLVSTDRPSDNSLTCNGNCCPELKCVPKTCPPSADTSFPSKCTHLKEKLDYQNGTCCPTKGIECKEKTNCPYSSPETCPEGYSRETSLVSASGDGVALRVQDCPMIDKCCPYAKCVCDSCKYSNGTINAGDEPVYSSDGCTMYTCTRRERMTDGCYKVTVKTPECAPPPPLECYQTSTEIPANPTTGNESDWKVRCCPKHRVDNRPCGEDYVGGPTSCPFPARLDVSYKTIDGCKYEHCPIRKCMCDKCIDSNNNTYAIGSTHSTPDGCDSFNCIASTECYMGMKSRSIPDSSITASNFYDALHAPYLARLDNFVVAAKSTGSWSARTSVVGDWLQIDLGTVQSVAGIITQGRPRYLPSQWVQSYKVKCGADQDNLMWVTENGQEKVFSANSDMSSKVYNQFPQLLQCRYIRIYPQTWNSHMSMRVELVRGACFKHQSLPECYMGMKSRSILDPSITASSFYDGVHAPYLARLDNYVFGYSTGSWTAKTTKVGQWLQIDVGAVQSVAGIITQGGPQYHQWVRSYKVGCGPDEDNLLMVTENGQEKIFTANSDMTSKVYNQFPIILQCRYIRIYPQSWNSRISMRVELVEGTCFNDGNLPGDGRTCPVLEKKTRNCPTLICDAKYETLKEDAVEGACCPNRTCLCKTEEMLKEVCEKFDNDTSHCSDPQNMEMVVIGSQPSHACCPLKKCRCKDIESRNCEFSNDYVCPANYTTILQEPVSSSNCCPKFKCDCNCSALSCNEVQIALSSPGECNCRCECDYTKCPVKPTCGPNESVMEVGKMFDGCCSDYQCVCNTSSCLSKPPVPCNEYQERYMATKDGCCEEALCRCKNDSGMLAKGCESTECQPGYKKSYRDGITKCCAYCTCNMCVTKEGNFTPGKTWNVTENDCTVTKICSESKESDGCNKAEIVHNENDLCTTIDEYKKQCSQVEEPMLSVDLSRNSCCDKYQCRCSTNVTKLRAGCSQYDGAQCSEYKQSRFVDVPNCCPVYNCVCKECDYPCPYGYRPIVSDNVNSTTDGCCYDYTCECDRCILENGNQLTIGESWLEQTQPRCFKNHTCVKNGGVCQTVIKDPSQDCTSLNEYEANHCNVPYQKALATAQQDPNNPCCVLYQCVCNDTNVCPQSSSSCMASQMQVISGKVTGTSSCCDDHTCVCKEKTELNNICKYSEEFRCSENGYEPVKVNSDDPCCSNYTCSCNPSKCEKPPPTTCEKGQRLVEEPSTGCCPNYTCQCSHCVSQSLEHRPGTNWTEDSCNTMSCVNTTNCPRIESTPKYSCNTSFDAEDCRNRGGMTHGTAESQGCCKECILVDKCRRVVKNTKVSQNISGELCETSLEIDVGSCEGTCPSIINHNPLTGHIEAICQCCSPTIEDSNQSFKCAGRPKAVQATVQRVTACGCGGH